MNGWRMDGHQALVMSSIIKVIDICIACVYSYYMQGVLCFVLSKRSQGN